MSDPSHSSWEKLMDDLVHISDDLKSIFHETADRAQQQILGDGPESLRHRLRGRLALAQGSIREVRQTATNTASFVARSTDDYVHEKPRQAIGLAAGLALLLGIMLGRH